MIDYQNPKTEAEFRDAIDFCDEMGWACEEEADRLKDESEKWYDRSRDLEAELKVFLNQEPSERPVEVSKFQISAFDVSEKQ